MFCGVCGVVYDVVFCSDYCVVVMVLECVFDEFFVYVFGRRKSGYFDIRRLSGIKVNKGSINCKELRLVEIRRTLLIERRNSGSIPPRS